jgi:phosphomannomutase
VLAQDGAQIRPAQAKRIEACMRRKPTERYELDETRLRSSPLVSDLTDACLDAYIAVAAKLRSRPVQENAKSRPVVYTALHGVGYPFVVRLFEAFGLPPVVPVDQQTLAPDPDFPSVAKPNPEERGGKWLYSWHRPPPRSAEVRSDWCHVRCLQALDMAIQRAKGCNATVVLANDPDADRLGVACVDSGTGSVRILTGNEIAALLADFLLLHCPAEKRGGVAMVRSTVSSKMLASMAQKEGFTVMETLTGFKWLSEGAARLAADGKVCLLAYEEALGYMIERGVRDKDGVTAAAVFAELAGHWEAQGRTVGQRMDELYDIYGHHLSHNDYLTITAESTPLAEVFDRARERGMPTVLGRCKVASVRDLTTGTDSAQPDNVALLPKDESTQFLTFTCRSPLLDGEPSTALDDVTISLRGSGTEPKLKWYSEIRVPSAAQRSVGLELLKEAVDDAIRRIVQPELNAYLF